MPTCIFTTFGIPEDSTLQDLLNNIQHCVPWALSRSRDGTRSDLRESYDICIWQPWHAGVSPFRACLQQGLEPLGSPHLHLTD